MTFFPPSTPNGTRRWVTFLFVWLASCLLAELLWRGAVILDLAILFGLVSAFGTAGWLIVSKRRRLPEAEQRPWSLLGIGMLMVAGGMAAMAISAIASPQVTAFGPMDIVFIAAYGVGLAGFALLPGLKTALISRQRLLLDGLIGAVSIAALMWALIGDELYAEVTASPRWDLVIGSTYPVLDCAGLVVVMLVVLKRSNYRFDPRLMAVGVTFLALAVGDVLYFKAGIGMGFLEANVPYSLHIVGAASILVSGVLVERQPAPKEYPDRDIPWLSLLAPYGAALVLVIATTTQIAGATTLDAGLRFLLLATSLVVALVVVRQLLAIRENRDLVERERDALVSTISHELRTPLTAVFGYLDILTDPTDPPTEEERDELMLVAREQAGHLSRMVSDLILTARESPATVELQPMRVALRPLIQEAVHSVEASIDVTVECPSDLYVDVDPARIHQALENMISNADRYGGSRCLVVADKPGRRLVLEVHDDGPGVPERYRVAIWKRFERGAHRLDASRPGSGIGLALVDNITRAHRGATGYRQSELLGGACFQLVLPQSAETAPMPIRLAITQT